MDLSHSIRQPENMMAKLWRYMDLMKFIYLLDQQRLYLPRADSLEDQHEGATPLEQRRLEENSGIRKSVPLEKFYRQQRKCTFISCWSHQETESHALWRVFCGPDQGVVVFTRYYNLVKLLPQNESLNVEVGLVDYGREEPIPSNTLIPFFRKRRGFAYEEEARLVVNMQRCRDAQGLDEKLSRVPRSLEKRVNLTEFIEGIRVHPDSSAAYQKTVQTVLRKFAPELLDLLKPSEMATRPAF